MHADELEPEDPEEIVTEWEQQRRVKANSKADAENYIRNLSFRGLVLSVVSGVDVRAIWREFGECNCPRPGMCDLCALPGLSWCSRRIKILLVVRDTLLD